MCLPGPGAEGLIRSTRAQRSRLWLSTCEAGPAWEGDRTAEVSIEEAEAKLPAYLSAELEGMAGMHKAHIVNQLIGVGSAPLRHVGARAQSKVAEVRISNGDARQAAVAGTLGCIYIPRQGCTRRIGKNAGRIDGYILRSKLSQVSRIAQPENIDPLGVRIAVFNYHGLRRRRVGNGTVKRIGLLCECFTMD